MGRWPSPHPRRGGCGRRRDDLARNRYRLSTRLSSAGTNILENGSSLPCEIPLSPGPARPSTPPLQPPRCRSAGFIVGGATVAEHAATAPRRYTGQGRSGEFLDDSCINCLRVLPHVRAWAEKYRDRGLVVVGVHTPEFAFEKEVANVRTATVALGVGYPVAIDNDFGIWRAFDNQHGRRSTSSAPTAVYVIRSSARAATNSRSG